MSSWGVLWERHGERSHSDAHSLLPKCALVTGAINDRCCLPRICGLPGEPARGTCGLQVAGETVWSLLTGPTEECFIILPLQHLLTPATQPVPLILLSSASGKLVSLLPEETGTLKWWGNKAFPRETCFSGSLVSW